jgi:hypothetical protein
MTSDSLARSWRSPVSLLVPLAVASALAACSAPPNGSGSELAVAADLPSSELAPLVDVNCPQPQYEAYITGATFCPTVPTTVGSWAPLANPAGTAPCSTTTPEHAPVLHCWYRFVRTDTTSTEVPPPPSIPDATVAPVVPGTYSCRGFVGGETLKSIAKVICGSAPPICDVCNNGPDVE